MKYIPVEICLQLECGTQTTLFIVQKAGKIFLTCILVRGVAIRGAWVDIIKTHEHTSGICRHKKLLSKYLQEHFSTSFQSLY